MKWEKIQRQGIASFIGHVFKLTYADMVDKLIQQQKLNRCHGCAIQHPSQNQHSCLMMDNDHTWMYYHDEVVEQIALNSMLKATESICSALGFNRLCYLRCYMKKVEGSGECYRCCRRILCP